MSTTSSTRPGLTAAQRRQLLRITLGAGVIFVVLRLLPTGTNLSHMDFRVDPRAGNAIEFCDPLNPQFIPVIAARSPVTMAITTETPAARDREVRATLELKTGSGKPVAPEDLVVTHTRRLHILIVDPSLADYQHVHPEPGAKAGEWHFQFTPRAAGTYRIFGDFTPAATNRGLYASVDLAVGGAAPSGSSGAALPGQAGDLGHSRVAERNGVGFMLVTAQDTARAGQPLDLRFTMKAQNGAAVPLEPVMGAYAHLVAFDAARSGFAHLHPTEADLLKRPDAREPTLNFKLTIPRAGRYTVWAQVNLAGTETFVPFQLDVQE